MAQYLSPKSHKVTISTGEKLSRCTSKQEAMNACAVHWHVTEIHLLREME